MFNILSTHLTLDYSKFESVSENNHLNIIYRTWQSISWTFDKILTLKLTCDLAVHLEAGKFEPSASALPLQLSDSADINFPLVSSGLLDHFVSTTQPWTWRPHPTWPYHVISVDSCFMSLWRTWQLNTNLAYTSHL